MNIAKRIAIANYDEEGRATTRSTSKHGARGAKKLARKINRAAIRQEKRRALREQLAAT
jgi:hypothetical protein